MGLFLSVLADSSEFKFNGRADNRNRTRALAAPEEIRDAASPFPMRREGERMAAIADSWADLRRHRSVLPLAVTVSATPPAVPWI